MGLLETQNFLARIYTDENLRHAFLKEPERIGLKAGLCKAEIADLTQILPYELNYFAESLFYKRLHGAEKFLPQVREVLKSNFENYFHEFANQFIPRSIKKHHEDAVEFCKFLRRKKLEPEWAKDVVKFEQAQMEFNAGDKRFIFKIFDYDLKTKQKRKKFHCWLMIGNRRIIF